MTVLEELFPSFEVKSSMEVFFARKESQITDIGKYIKMDDSDGVMEHLECSECLHVLSAKSYLFFDFRLVLFDCFVESSEKKV